MEQILVVEDEPSIADTLVYALKTEGFQVTHVSTLEAARSRIEAGGVDLVVLDVGLPDGSGFEFCKELRRTTETPILFLTARSSEVDRIVGLEIGGDDYVTKPFSPREITARVKVILKRLKRPQSGSSTSGTLSPPMLFSIDTAKMRIALRGRVLELSRYEYGLLKLFIENPGRVYSRAQLMDLVWSEPEMSLDRTVDAHIKMLRQKIREIAPDEEFIITHRGIGYAMKDFTPTDL